MNHVTDELELFALDALPAADRARVAEHLAGCPACREQARSLEEVAIALPETLEQRDVPSRVRTRILATARGELAAPKTRRETAWTAWLSPSRFAMAALVAAVLILATVDLATIRQRDAAVAARDAAVAQRDANADIVLRFSHGGQSWYMAGLDQWAGAGGTLVAPSKPDAAAYVVFHDLRPIDSSAVYALWLVDGDGHWMRAANFTFNGELAQAVILDAPVNGFRQCAVTIEPSREGKRTGPVIMQSRLSS